VKVAILCGGLGTRLREETEYRPKPMVEVGGRPILWHILGLRMTVSLREAVARTAAWHRCLRAEPLVPTAL